MKKFFAIALLFFAANVCVAQVVDDFSDGNFSSNPTWSGSNTDFIINASNQLQLNNTIAGTSYLATPFMSSDLSQVNIEWQIYVKQTFAPSGSNFGRVYLTSDQSDLTQPLNGYYLQFGEAGSLDAIELFRQSGSTRVSVCRGTAGLISASFAVHVKVLRDNAGNWQLFTDYTGGNSFALDASGTDNVHATSSFMGITCVYTATNATKFFYDSFLITTTPIPDITPPTLQSISIVNANTIDAIFSEPLDPSANEVSNYSVGGIGSPSSAILQSDNKRVRLSFVSSFQNGLTHQLTSNGIKDLVGNEMISASKDFLFFQPTSAQKKDIILNEFFPDPSPVIGLPDQEFIELYNRSNNPFDLAGWKLTDGSSTAVLPNQIILPQEYWIVTSTSSAATFLPFGKTLGVSNFPTLNNSGDKIMLLDPSGLTVDSLNYNWRWYNDADKQQGGWSLELLNPDTLRYDSANWLSSLDPAGGTPGKQNSQFGNKFDQISPLWLTVSAITDHQIDLTFNEPLDPLFAQDVNNFSSKGNGKPVAASLSPNKKIISLMFENSFANGVTDSLTVAGLIDLSGNAIVPSTKCFLYFQPSPVLSKDIVITEFLADPTPVIGLPEAEYIELYNRSHNPVNLANWNLSDGSSSAKFPSTIIQPNEYWIVTNSSGVQLFSSFGNVIGLSGFPSLNNSGDKILLFDSNGLTIDSLTFNLKWFTDADKQQGGWSLELLNPDTLRYDSANWLASLDPSGGTPGKQNSQFGNKFDQTPPVLDAISVINQTQLQLEFNETIEQSSALALSNYIVNNMIGNPEAATISANRKSVTLTFQREFGSGITNQISINNISDLSGNPLQKTLKDFLYFKPLPVNNKDIIITEIMADPVPVVGLPEAEYIEIYNRSVNAVDLTNWTLTDGSSIAKFPSKIIRPGEYCIVNASTSSQLNSFSNRVAVSSFPSLNNSSDSIVLKNSIGLTIDSVAYSSLWYKNSDKQEGGWSLELIDPNNTCGEGNNWTASEDESGGTPGKQNSVFANKPDLTGPKLESVVVLKSNELLLTFDERLEKQVLASSFVLTPGIGVFNVYFNGKALREIRLHLSTELSSRQLYTITIKNLRDCNGNSIQEEFSSLSFALPEAADSLDVLVNEILFNPRPNGVDFVEVYNNSLKYINLKNWKLASTQNGTVTNEEVISSSDFILPPFTHLALTEDRVNVMNNYPLSTTGNLTISKLPSLPDDEGSVVIINAEGEIIDQFAYNKNLHSPLIKDEEGVSLERISFAQPTQDANNWKSASAAAGFATPGYLNSNARPESLTDENSVLVEPEIFSPDSSPEFAKINYRFDQSNFSANVKVFDQQGRLIKTIANNETLPYEGFFRWDGDREDGSRARMGYYLVWFEVFDSGGFLKTFRKRVVLAGN